MNDILSVVVVACLALWLAISVLAQVRGSLVRRLKRHDYCALIPAWSFFAPNPGMSDYHLYFRDRLASGALSFWRELPIEREPSVLRAVWNPQKRDAKAFVDYVGELRSLARDYPLRNLQLTLAYQAVCNRVCAEPTSFAAESRQFAIVESHGYYDAEAPALTVLSNFHRLTREDA